MRVTESWHLSRRQTQAPPLMCLPPRAEGSPVQSILFRHSHLYSKETKPEIIHSFLKVKWSSAGFLSEFRWLFYANHQKKSLSNRKKTLKELKPPTEDWPISKISCCLSKTQDYLGHSISIILIFENTF